MKKQDYLEQLSQALPKDPLSQRFMKEMRDHVEDAEEKGTIKNSLSESFGETMILQKHFRNVLFHRHLFYGVLQTFLLSLLSCLLYIAAMWSQGMFILNFKIWDLSWYLPAELFFLAALFLLYYRGLPDIFLYAPSFWRRLPFIVGIFIFPALLVYFYILSAVKSYGADIALMKSEHVLLLSLVPLAIGIVLFSCAYLLRHKKRMYQNTIIARRKIIFCVLGTLFILAIILARLVLRWSLTAAGPFEIDQYKFLMIGAAPFFMADFIVMMMSNAVFSFLPLALRFWILGIILVIIAGIILLQILSHFLYREPRTFPLFRLGILVYIVLLLLVPFQEERVESIVPMTNISKRIEKAQMGPFYSMTKYFNANEGDFGQYTLYSGKEAFVLGQGRERTNGPTYFLVKNIQDTEKMDIASTTAPGPDFRSISNEPKPASVQCVDKNKNFSAVTENSCDTLTFYGQDVFSYLGWGGWFQDFALTKDEQFMIVHISSGFFDPGTVYLLDLRSLQPQP